VSRIRISGGQWRSRLIEVVDAPGLRPTPDRVRETLFNWLGHDLTGLSVLDLFAGSGILGIEAASRGAASVHFVEREAKARALLHRHLAQLSTDSDAPACLVHAGDALKFSPSEPVDLLFLDPPYRQNLLEKIAPRLPLLAKPDALIYVEAEHAITTLGDWRVSKQGKAGQVFYHLLEHA
jgi:16S rRNA (guanine966-N2)-methyltransferase